MPEERVPNVLTTRGEVLSRVGIGTASFVRDDDEVAMATLRRALERGINWIDTDAVFGFGNAERIVGRALAEFSLGERPFVATAVGLDWDGRLRRTSPHLAMEPRRIRQQLQRSLSRLGLEAVELVKLNFADGSDVLFEDAWSMLLDLKQAGLTRAIGLIAPDSARLERAERLGACDAVYVELSLINRRIGDSELLWRRPPAPMVIAYRTLGGGALISNEGTSSSATAQARPLVRTIAQRRHTAPSAVATAWSLAWPGIAAAAVGARTPEEVDAVADATAIELSVRDLSDIANLLPNLGGDLGPVHPRRFAKAA